MQTGTVQVVRKPKRKYRRRKLKKHPLGWERTIVLNVSIPWPSYQKVRYAERHRTGAFPLKASQLVTWAINDWFDSHPDYVKGYKPDRKLEDSRGKDGFVYLMLSETGLYKIGRSTDCQARLKAVKQQERCGVTFIGAHDVSDAHAAERAAHAMFAEKREHGEWFRLTPSDVDKFKALTNKDLHQQRKRKEG
jgi:hypothetical protein